MISTSQPRSSIRFRAFSMLPRSFFAGITHEMPGGELAMRGRSDRSEGEPADQRHQSQELVDGISQAEQPRGEVADVAVADDTEPGDFGMLARSTRVMNEGGGEGGFAGDVAAEM